MANYMNDLQELQELREEKDDLIKKAGDRLASALIKMNSNGISNVNAIQNDIKKALDGWTEAEKNLICARALAKLVINL